MTLANLKMDSDVEEATDVVGGGGRVDSGIYPLKIDVAYTFKSKKGALGVALRGTINGSAYREDVYVTGGDAKGNKPYYERDGKKYPLPGYSTIDDICIVAANTLLSDMETEEKSVGVYDYDLGKEVATDVDTLPDLKGQTVNVAIKFLRNFKQEENAEGDWEDTDVVRESNEISKVFDEDMATVKELKDKVEPAFADKWIKANEGKVFGSAAKADAKPAGAGTAGAPKTAKRMFGG